MNTFLIYQEIGALGVCSSDVLQFLEANKNKDVQVRINSVGGSVSEGIAIYNLFKNHSGKVEIVIDSICASIATIVALGGTSRKMNLGSSFMIHNPWTFTQGEASDLRKTADELDFFKKTIVSIYMNFFKKSEEELASMMDQTTWLSDVEAMKLGFIDSIENDSKAVAQLKNWDLKKYFNTLPTKGQEMKEKTEKVSSEVEVDEVEKKAESSAETSADETKTEGEAEEVKSEEEEKVEETESEETEETEAPEEDPEKVEETESEETEEEKAEIENKVSPEIMNSIDVKAQIETQVQAGIQAEMKRREEIENLAFSGQESLVKNLIDENCTIEEASLRIIENKKSMEISGSGAQAKADQVSKTPAEQILETMNSGAPAPLNEGSGEEVESLDQLKASYLKLKDPKEKALLAQKMAKLKKEIASSNNKR